MKAITTRRYEAATENYEGFCTRCQKFTRDCTEPDAEGYDCPCCKQLTVMGAEQALMVGALGIK